MDYHSHAAPTTEGRLIRWAWFYDISVQLLTFGQARSLRVKSADLAGVQAGDAVLDVGCGTGDLTMELARRAGTNGRVAGIDAAPEMIDVAQRKATKAHLTIDYRNAAIEALPFADSSFDVVTSSMMMHHLPPDPQRRGLAELYRVLKPTGRVVVVDVVAEGALHHFFVASTRHHLPGGVTRIAALMRETGFQEVDEGPVKWGVLGFARGKKRA